MSSIESIISRKMEIIFITIEVEFSVAKVAIFRDRGNICLNFATKMHEFLKNICVDRKICLTLHR